MVNCIDLFHAYDTDMLSNTGINSAKIFMILSCCEKFFERKNCSKENKYGKRIDRNMHVMDFFFNEKKPISFCVLN